MEKGADEWSQALHCSCKSGHIKIANHILGKGINKWTLDHAFEGACEGGHKKIIDLLI